MEKTCEECFNKEFCVICENQDFYITKEQKEWNDYMCDLMCGGVENDEI